MTPEEMLALPEGTLCKIVELITEEDTWSVGGVVVRVVKGHLDDERSATFCCVYDNDKWDYFCPEEVEVLDTQEPKNSTEQEYTGSSSSYYTVKVKNPTTEGVSPYDVECNDLIEALGMSFAEGNAFKAIWRSCAARNLGKVKRGYVDGTYDAEKVIFFGERMLAQALYNKSKG